MSENFIEAELDEDEIRILLDALDYTMGRYVLEPPEKVAKLRDELEQAYKSLTEGK